MNEGDSSTDDIDASETDEGIDLTLCLSGGGFRAAAYHLGGVRRLHELGILPKVQRLSCVSGGSILGAFLLQRYPAFQGQSMDGFDWTTQIEEPFGRIVCGLDLRTWPVLKRWGLTALFAAMTCLWFLQVVVTWLRLQVASLGTLGSWGLFGAAVVTLAILAIRRRWKAIAGAVLLAAAVVPAVFCPVGAVVAGTAILAIAMPCMTTVRWGLVCSVVLLAVLVLEVWLASAYPSIGAPAAWVLWNGAFAAAFASWAVGRPSSSVESLRGLYTRHLVAGRKDIPLHQLVPLDLPLEFCFNATDIIFGVRWVAERCRRKGGGYHHRVGSYRAGYGFYEGKRPLAAEKQWSLARAVAASSCFPPVFGPMKIRWSASDYRKPSYLGVGKTRELRESDRRRKLEAMMVNDGGNYGNLGLLAASRAKVVIVSDGGAPLDYSPPEGPFQLLGRYSGLLMSVNVNQSLQELLKAFESSKKKGAIARIGRRLDDRQNTPEAIERHWNAQWIAGIRTDLAPLTALEYQATKELGYVSIDERIERYGRDVLPISKAAPATDVEVLDDPELDRKMAFRKCRMLAPWLRRWLTRPIRRH